MCGVRLRDMVQVEHDEAPRRLVEDMVGWARAVGVRGGRRYGVRFLEKCTTTWFPTCSDLTPRTTAVLYNPMSGPSAHISGLTHLHAPE